MAALGLSMLNLIPGILGGLGGLIGGATPKKTTETSSSSSEGTSNSTNISSQQLQTLLNTLSQISGTTAQQNTSTTHNVLSPEAQALQTQLGGAYSKLAATSTDLRPYAAAQAQTINNNSALQQRASDQMLASRGLSTSPAAATAAGNIDAQRIAQQTQLQQSLPLLQNQMQLANLQGASQFYGQIPHDTITSGSQTGQSTQLGNTSQTGFNNTTGQQISSGSTTNNTNGTSTTIGGGGAGAGIAGGLAGLLAGLFGQR